VHSRIFPGSTAAAGYLTKCNIRGITGGKTLKGQLSEQELSRQFAIRAQHKQDARVHVLRMILIIPVAQRVWALQLGSGKIL